MQIYCNFQVAQKLSATDAAGNGLVYVGSLVFEKQNGVLSLESAGFGDGRFVKDGTTYQPNYFITDHLGSTRVVVDANGTVQERSDYYPYGMRWDSGNELISGNRYRYNGKEEQGFLNVPYSDYGARMYDPRFRISWGGVDPLTEKTPGMSPFVFCNNTPINAIDPDGCSTWVMPNSDGTYRVIGGDLDDDDVNIYIYNIQGGKLVRGLSIGVTTSTTSFYNSDKDGGTWATGSIINPNDESGSTFLNNITENSPTMFDDYIANAGNGQKYDFKVTNGTNQIIKDIDIYRGMPIGSNESGQKVYSSARDIGNIAAGFIAGSNGMSWGMSRLAFDAYQSKVSGKFVREGLSTQNAEYYGWRLGNSLPKMEKLMRFGWSVTMPILKAEFQLLEKILK